MSFENIKTVQDLKDKGHDYNENWKKDLYLHSCKTGNLELIKFMDKRSDIYLNVSESLKNDVKKLDTLRTRYFIDRTNLTDRFGNNCYLIAIDNGHLNIALYYEDLDKKLANSKNKIGADGFLLAAYSGNIEIMEHFIEFHNKNRSEFWSINFRDINDNDAMLTAAQSGKVDVIDHLFTKYGWDKYTQNVDGNNIFHIGIKYHNHNVIDYVRYSIDNFDIFKRNKDGMDGYLVAVDNELLDTIQYLETVFHCFIEKKLLTQALNISMKDYEKRLAEAKKTFKTIQYYVSEYRINLTFCKIGNLTQRQINDKVIAFRKEKEEEMKDTKGLEESVKSNITNHFENKIEMYQDLENLTIIPKPTDMDNDAECIICLEEANGHCAMSKCIKNHIVHTDCLLNYLHGKKDESILDSKCIYCSCSVPKNYYFDGNR